MAIVHSKRLRNGLRVVVTPHKVDSITLCLRGLAGSNYENRKELGAAHFLEHLLLETSDKNMILSLGGRITATTSRDDVAFLVKLLKEDLAVGIKYLAEVYTNEDYSQNSLRSVKNTIKHEIRQNSENPIKHIGRIAYKILYPNQRFSILNTGTLEDVEVLEKDSLKSFRKKHYELNNFVLSVCGDIEPQNVFKFAERHFKFKEKKKVKFALNHNYSKNLAFQVEKRASLQQTHLRIDYEGFKTSDNKKYPALIAAKIIRDQVYKKLRTRPYILDVASFSSNSYGLFGLYTAISEDMLDEFFASYIFALKKCRANGISEYKKKIHTDFVFALEKTSLRADHYSELYLYKNNEKNHLEEIEKVMQCSEADVEEIIREVREANPKITVLTKNLAAEDIKNIYNKASVQI